MAQSNDEFRMKTLVFFTCMFLLMALGHSVALMAKGDIDTINPNDHAPASGVSTSGDSGFDVSDPGMVIGAIMLGIDLPMPFPIAIIAWNGISLFCIAYAIQSWIRSWIPLIGGG